MSSVHYKFKATLEYKTLTFDGLHIGVDELKKAICDKENIRTESFDLLLTNAHTKREYTTGELVPRNSSVVVQRLPRDNASKLPKVQDTTNSGIVQRSTGSQPSTYINQDDFSKLTEEQKIAHVKQISAEKYSAANYQKRPIGIMSGPPPPTYVCNRCAQPGHWYKNCPLVNTKRTTGIPMDELMETTKDDPLAMLHPSGKFVKSIMHFQARLQRKHEPFPGQANDSTGSPCDDEQKSEVPDQYKCFLCKGILRDAVLAACCGHSFCAECYQQQLLANPVERCPGPECSQQISADSLIPNKSLRSAIQKYLNEFKTCSETTEQHQSGGVNKPSVLTDTQSLLHKLMPDLAYAQAQRELATTATTTTAAAVHSSPPQQEITQSFTPLPSQSISVNNPPIAASTTTAIHDANLFLQPKIPIFDPKRPPPPINLPPIYASQNYPITPPNIIPSSGLLTPEKGSITQVTSSINSVQPKGLVSASPLSAQELISVWEKFLERKDNERRKNNSSIITADKVSISHVTTSINSTTTHQQKNVSPLSSQELSSVWEKFLERKDNERGTNVISSSSFTKVEKGSVAQVTNTSTNNGVQQKSERKHVSSPSTKELSPVRGKDKQEKKKSKKRKKERKDEKEDDEKKRKKKKQDGNDNEEEKKKKNKSEDGKDDEEKKKKNKKDEENGDEEKKKKKEEGTDNEEKKKKKEDGKEEEKKMKNKSEGEKENDEKKKKKKREHEKDGEEKKKKKKEKGGKKKEKAEKKEKERGRKDKRRKEKKEDKEKDRKTRKRKKEEKRDHHHEGKERGGRKRNEREERTTKEEKKSN